MAAECIDMCSCSSCVVSKLWPQWMHADRSLAAEDGAEAPSRSWWVRRWVVNATAVEYPQWQRGHWYSLLDSCVWRWTRNSSFLHSKRSVRIRTIMRNCTCIKNKTVSACLRNEEDHPHLSITLSLKLHCSDCPFFTAAFLETSLFTPPFLHSVPLSLKLHSSDHPSVYSTFLETPLFRSPFFQCLFPWNPTPQITLLSTPLFLKPHSLDHPSSNTSFLETPLFRSPTSFNATFLSKKPHSLYVYLSVNKPLTKYHISVQATLKRLQSAFAEKWFHCSNMFRHRVKKKSSPTFGIHCNVTCLQRNLSTA